MTRGLNAPTAPAERTSRPYRFSLWFLAAWFASVAVRRRRNLGTDSARLFGRRTPAPRVEGREHVPAQGPCIVAMNHYERPGLRVWWPAALVTRVLWEARGESPPLRWLITDRFHRYRVGPLVVPEALIRWLLRRIEARYQLILVPRGEQRHAGRASALAEAERALRPPTGGPPRAIGITPDIGAAGSRLATAWRNAGLALARLSAGELPIVPVAVFEDDSGALVARFGPPFTLAWPGHVAARAAAADLATEVMARIAELLPPELRGPYGAVGTSVEPAEP